MYRYIYVTTNESYEFSFCSSSACKDQILYEPLTYDDVLVPETKHVPPIDDSSAKTRYTTLPMYPNLTTELKILGLATDKGAHRNRISVSVFKINICAIFVNTHILTRFKWPIWRFFNTFCQLIGDIDLMTSHHWWGPVASAMPQPAPKS